MFKTILKARLALISFIIFFLLACQNPDKTIPPMASDIHSFSKPHEAVVTHLHWNAAIDFDTKTIAATATWSIKNISHAATIVLDTKMLSVKEVRVDNVPVKFQLGEEDSIMGRALIIPIENNTQTISIEYKTSPEAEALQWLNVQQTADKKHPFLFSQSQAILARSWVPCQDSPGVRFTYSADVKVPVDLLPLMSATNPKEKNNSGIYHFEMKQPIPSYLLAISVGDVAFKAISARSGIYAEPSLLDTATWEFADMEKMIASAEELYGPYRWEEYDVIVLPPSFPFGGMENPRLTFATPTILSGDRSLTSLIAHELAHSWSGNLVTNATWNDFWLNEGFTVYFETRIMEKLYGKSYSEMLASLNLKDLQDEIISLNKKGLSADTKLKLDLTGRNPDDGVTEIAYNKGYFFLRTIEEKYGRDKFDTFVKDYFTDNAFHSMDTDSFIDFIKNYYQKNFSITLDENLFTDWIFSEGLPAYFPKPNAERFEKVDEVVKTWLSSGKLEYPEKSKWSTHEWLHFLNSLPENVSTQQLKHADAFGNFSETGNSELIANWGVIALKHGYEKMFPKLESFLINTGRRKFLTPLYKEMVKTEKGKVMAKRIYEQARPNYHFVAVSSIDKLVLK